MVTYINKVWNDESYIRKETIVNCFKKAGIVGNSYFSLEEENTIDNYLFDLGLDKNIEILDDLDDELSSDNIISKNDTQKDDDKNDLE